MKRRWLVRFGVVWNIKEIVTLRLAYRCLINQEEILQNTRDREAHIHFVKIL